MDNVIGTASELRVLVGRQGTPLYLGGPAISALQADAAGKLEREIGRVAGLTAASSEDLAVLSADDLDDLRGALQEALYATGVLLDCRPEAETEPLEDVIEVEVAQDERPAEKFDVTCACGAETVERCAGMLLDHWVYANDEYPVRARTDDELRSSVRGGCQAAKAVLMDRALSEPEFS